KLTGHCGRPAAEDWPARSPVWHGAAADGQSEGEDECRSPSCSPVCPLFLQRGLDLMHSANLEPFGPQETIDFGNAELPRQTRTGNLARERIGGHVCLRARSFA